MAKALLDIQRVNRTNSINQKDKRPQKRPHHYITQSVKNGVYMHTMDHVRHELKPLERTSSRFIHQPSIESLSDLIGSTIMLPYAVLYGATSMVVGGLGVLFFAYYAGFTLSPFLLPILYIAGFFTTIMVIVCWRLLHKIKTK